MNGRMHKQLKKQMKQAMKQNLYHWVLWCQDLDLKARWSISWRVLFKADVRALR